jgi:hypothetical protein
LGFAASPGAGAADNSADGCSADTVIERDFDNPAFDKAELTRIRAAREKLRSSLVASSDVRQQALGLGLQTTAAASEEHIDSAVALSALATLAASSEDPVVYAIALRVCAEAAITTSNTACDAISSNGWARSDPDNAVPWLELANEADRRQDFSAEAEDFHRAAVAHRFDSDMSSVLAIAAPAMPSGLSRLEQYYLYSGLIGFQSMVGPYAHSALGCSSFARANSDLMKDCRAIAENMVASGQNLTDLGVGTRLGEAAGWPAQRVAALQREQHALMMLVLGDPRDFDVPLSCQKALRQMDRVTRWAVAGEIPTLRAELQSSGLSIDDLAAQYDQWQAAIRSKVKAAAK